MRWERKRDLLDWLYPLLFLTMIVVGVYAALWILGYAECRGDPTRLPRIDFPFFS
jgi:hypothetical protein